MCAAGRRLKISLWVLFRDVGWCTERLALGDGGEGFRGEWGDEDGELELCGVRGARFVEECSDACSG